MLKEKSLTNNYLSGFYWLTKSNRKIVITPDQLMVRFGASWFGILGATLKITIPFKGHPNFPNHHTPKQLTISRAVDLATNPGNQYFDPAWMVPSVADLRLHLPPPSPTHQPRLRHGFWNQASQIDPGALSHTNREFSRRGFPKRLQNRGEKTRKLPQITREKVQATSYPLKHENQELHDRWCTGYMTKNFSIEV